MYRKIEVLALLMAAFALSAAAQTASFSYAIATLGGGFNGPFGMAVDGSGNVYVADQYGSAVKEMPAGCASSSCVTTLGGGFNHPQGVTVDGSGNVYVAGGYNPVADGNNTVTEMPAGCASSSCVTKLGGGFKLPSGVAVDAIGNVYVADTYNHTVKEMPAGCASSSCVTSLGGGFSYPEGVAVDGSGNVYVADSAVYEMPAGCASSSCVTMLGGTDGFSYAEGVTVDGSGNIYFTKYSNSAVYEMPAGCASSSCVTSLGSGFSDPTGVAVDGSGNVYVADAWNFAVYEIMTRGVNFFTVPVGTTSAAITLTFTFESAGSLSSTTPYQVLTQGAKNLDFNAAATQESNVCNGTTAYTTGETCTVNVTFTPIFPGTRYGAAVLYDTSGNVLATAYLQGTGVGPQVNFLPGVQSQLSLPNVTDPSSIAVDAAGNLYIVEAIVAYDPANSVFKETWNGSGYTQSTVATGLGYPTGIAIDGAGNIYIADQDGFTVFKETPTANGSYTQSIVDYTLGTVGGIAVDGAGNVYIGRGGIGVEKETLSGGNYIRSEILYTFFAYAIAVDSAGVLYFANGSNDGILTETPSGGAYIQGSIGSGQNVANFALDGIGNIYLFGFGNSALVKETLLNGNYIQSIVPGVSGQGRVAVDSAGNVYYSNPEAGSVWKIEYADAPILHFAATAVGQTSTDSPQTATIQNTGNATLNFPIPGTGSNPVLPSGFTLRDSFASDCPVVSASAATPGTLAPGASCDLPISFAPEAVGTLSGSLVLTDNNLNAAAPDYASQSIALSGTAIQATPTITWATPAAITYGAGLGSGQLNATSSVAGSFAYSPVSGTVLGAGPQTLKATFTPTDTTDYKTASATATLTVNQATPTITWATPAAITYGAGLGSGQLNATSSVAGSFAYSPVSGTVLGAGPQTLKATFTPTDTTDYATATATVTLTVNQATPSITWATPAAITSGTALSSTQLNATASVPGTFVYNPALGATPPVGNDTLSVTFTPTDSVDYATATSTVILTVNTPPNPVPFVGNITPAIADAGGTAFTINVNGSGFLANSTVYWGTTALTTQYVSSTQLTATVTAADIATSGATAINVQTPAPGGGTSDILQFEVDSPAATTTAPTIPSTVVSITAGSTATYSISFPAAVTSATATCLNLPAGAICSYSSATKVLTITTASTTPAGTYQVTVVFAETVTSTATAGILLPILLLPLFFLRRKLASRSIWSAACLGLILLATTAFSIGCGGSSSSTSKQTTQSVTSSVVVALIVQ
jgi:sugar lactone lactonase YvrE